MNKAMSSNKLEKFLSQFRKLEKKIPPQLRMPWDILQDVAEHPNIRYISKSFVFLGAFDPKCLYKFAGASALWLAHLLYEDSEVPFSQEGLRDLPFSDVQYNILLVKIRGFGGEGNRQRYAKREEEREFLEGEKGERVMYALLALASQE